MNRHVRGVDGSLGNAGAMTQNTAAQNQVVGVHLVGSINFDDAETTIRTATGELGAHLKRIPDGEVGERWHWIMFRPGKYA